MGKIDGSDPGPKRKSLEGLVECNCNQKNHERRARSNRHRHANEYTVEEDARFEKQAL
jgi:hypothetical protein